MDDTSLDKQSEERFRDIINFLPDATFVIDASGKVIAWNHAIEELTGVSAREMLGKADYEYSLPFYGNRQPILIDLVLQPRDEVEDNYAVVSRHGNGLVAETRATALEGRYLWAAATPLYDSEGNTTGAIETIRDITERRRAEERRATLYHAAQTISAGMNRDQICAAIHHAAAQVMTVDAVAISLLVDDGQAIEDVYLFDAGRRWPGDRYSIGPGLTSFIVTTGRSLRTGELAETTARLGIKLLDYGDETYKSRSVVATPMHLRGRVKGMLLVSSYAPNRYTAEDQQLVEMLAIYAAVAFENARLFEETNRYAEQMAMLNRIGITITSGLDMGDVLSRLYLQCQQTVPIDTFYVALYDQATGVIEFPLIRDKEMTIEIPPHNIDSEPGLTGHVIRTGRTLYIPDTLDGRNPLSLTGIHAGGTPARSYVGVPLMSRGEVIGVLSMQSYRTNAYAPEQIDVLETIAIQAAIAIENARLYADARRAQQAAEQALKAAEAANRAKTIFLANMSHELRTPLNAVLGFTELMARDSNLTPAQHENLGIVSRSGEHLLSLINDVLEMSKIEAGRVELNPTAFDLRYMLRGLTEMFRLRAEGKGLSLILDRDPNVPRYIRADEGKLRQVLINLLSNAVKFTEHGGITLRVRSIASGEGSDDAKLDFEVEDTGVGISPDEAKVIFNAFVQTASGQKSHQGTGLGLSISRQYVRMMGGQLTVKSVEGEGSAFSFQVPVECLSPNQVGAQGSAVGQVVALRPGTCAPDGSPFRLLVVDDDESSRKLLVQLFESLGPGLEIREAMDGQAAVELRQEWNPHLVWMDMRMPVMDGYEATRQIKARAGEEGQTVTVVALTAGAFEEEREQILAQGCDDFVRKPFRQSDILDVLTRHLGIRFIYSDAPDAQTRVETRGEESASAIRLSDLPVAVLADLRNAAVQGDLEWLTALVEQIQPTHPAQAAILHELIENYALDRILVLLDQAGQ